MSLPIGSGPGPTPPDLFRVVRAERLAPLPHSLVTDHDPAPGQKRWNVVQAQVEPVPQPDDLTDNDRRKPVPRKPRISTRIHPEIISDHGFQQLDNAVCDNHTVIPRTVLMLAGVAALAAASISVPQTATAAHRAANGGQWAAQSERAAPGLPISKLNRQHPLIVMQPRVTKTSHRRIQLRGESRAPRVRSKVLLSPWRTPKSNRTSKHDRLEVTLDIAKPGVSIRSVGLSQQSRRAKLMYTTSLKPRRITKAGVYSVDVPVSARVAASLARLSVRNQNKRIRLSISHIKDVRDDAPGLDVTQLAESGLGIGRAPTYRSSELTSRSAQMIQRSSNESAIGWFVNYSPFSLDMNIQGTQCFSVPQWSGSLGSGGLYTVSARVTADYKGSANGHSTWQSLTSDTVKALGASAQSAASNAINQGAATFTPEGAASTAVTWSADFLVDLIKGGSIDSCGNMPSTWTTSAVASAIDIPTSGPYTASWSADSSGQPSITSPLPTTANLVGTLGAQVSVQWAWNGGNVVPAAGGGGSNYAGGLIALADPGSGSTAGNLFINYFFQNTGEDIYGPVQSQNGSVKAKWVPQEQTSEPAAQLTCDAGSWNFESPWGAGAQGSTWNLSNPPNTNSGTQSQGVITFYYNATNSSGAPQLGQPIPGLSPIVSGYSSLGTSVQVNQDKITAIQTALGPGGAINSWGCSVVTQAQVSSFALPSGWPSGTSTSNMAWYSAPGVNFTAPYTAN